MKGQGHAQILHHSLKEMSAKDMKEIPKSVLGRTVQVILERHYEQCNKNMQRESFLLTF